MSGVTTLLIRLQGMERRIERLQDRIDSLEMELRELYEA